MVDMDNPAALSPQPLGAVDKDAPLKEDIRLLGRLLGDVLRDQEGEAVFDLVARPPCASGAKTTRKRTPN
jgi:phosphoenolpyruvate carboxylase